MAAIELRDYFAGQALAGIMASRQQFEAGIDAARRLECDPPDMWARVAYHLADAMLEARK